MKKVQYVLLSLISYPLNFFIYLMLFSKWCIARWCGLRQFFDLRLSYGANDIDHIELPSDLRVRFKKLMFYRGIRGNNLLKADESTKIIDDMLDYLKKNCSEVKAKEIETVDYLALKDPDLFYEKFVKSPRPIILKNVDIINLHPWNMDYFKKKFGSSSVLVSDVKTGKHQDQLFSEFMAKDDDNYIHNCEKLWAVDPALWETLNISKFQNLLRRDVVTAQMFIGKNKGSHTAFHCANNYNIFFQLKGKKRWSFVNPEYTYLMYPVFARNNGYFGARVPTPETNDDEKNPLFKYCPRYSAILSDGDVLINPPLWWHSVQALTEETLSVSSRWSHPSLSTLLGNKFGKNACDTNHVFTSLIMFTPWHLSQNRLGIAHVLNEKIFKKSSFSVTHIVEKNRTSFEFASHDDLSERGNSGELDLAWCHKKV